MKGVIPLVAIALLALIALTFLKPAAITDAACYTPGNPVKITVGTMKILQSASNSYICAYLPYTNDAGKAVWESQCRLFGTVTKDQVIIGESFGVRLPADAQSARQVSRISISVASVDSTAKGGTGTPIPQFVNSISEEDTAWVIFDQQCPAPVVSGERAVNYFQRCDNTNPDQGKLVYCEKETFSGATSSCSTSRYVFCEQGAVCQQTESVGVCFQKQGPAFAKCGDQWDNKCPAGCLLYQDRDCCVQSGAEWDVISSVCRSKAGDTVSTTDQLEKVQEQKKQANFVAVIVGSLILSLMILIITAILGIFFPPVRVLAGFIYSPIGFIVALSALSLIFIIFTAGSSIGAASILGIS